MAGGEWEGVEQEKSGGGGREGSSDDVLTKCFVRYVNIFNVYKNMQKRGVQQISKDLFDS